MSNVSIAPVGETVFDTIKAIHQGDVALDLDQGLRDVVEAVTSTGKGGSITLTLTVKNDSRLGAVRLSGDVKVKLPKQDIKEALFFPTPEGNLSRYDARQRDMFREHQGQRIVQNTAPIIDHDEETGEVKE